jgi:hypothetical protein
LNPVGLTPKPSSCASQAASFLRKFHNVSVALYFRGIPTYPLELFHQVYWRKIPLYRLNQTWLFQEGFQITREVAYERLKRAADVALSSAVSCSPHP